MENLNDTSVPIIQKYNSSSSISQDLNSDKFIPNTINEFINNQTNITNSLNKDLIINSTNELENNLSNISRNINISSTILEQTTDIINDTNIIKNTKYNNSIPNISLDNDYITEIIINNNSNNIHNDLSINITKSTDTNIISNMANISPSYNTYPSDIPSSILEEKTISNINKTFQNNSNIQNITSNTTKNSESNIFENIKNLDKKYILSLEILFPAIILIIILIIIIYCCKRKLKSQVNQISNNTYDKNGIKFQSSGNNGPYNRIQNTSGINAINPNNFSMSEIKVQNLKDEIHNIITNKSSGSNSSGKRKREKRRMGNNNKINSSSQENNIGAQNQIKEEIKQYVIDEHLNN